jgi:hypothetical protein
MKFLAVAGTPSARRKLSHLREQYKLVRERRAGI